MDSYIGNYHKFYRGTNYLDEMKEVLSDAAKWVVDSLVAHYGADAHAKGNTPAPLVPENVPGYELGLRVMELQVVKPPSYRKVLSVIRNTPQTAGAVLYGVDDSKIAWRDATVSYHNIWEDKHGTYKVTEADALYISDDSRYFGLYTESDEKSIMREKIRYAYDRIDYFAPKPAAKVFSSFSIASPFSGYLPILYSFDLGEVFYLELSRLNLTKSGLSKGLCAQPGELIAANFITGETHIIASIAEIERPVLPFEVHYKTPLPPTCKDVVVALPWGLKDAMPSQSKSIHVRPLQVYSWDEYMELSAIYGQKNCFKNTVRAEKCAMEKMVTPFLEQLFDIPEDSLAIAPYWKTSAVNTRWFLDVAHYMGNLFQSVLQTATYSPWFLGVMLTSIRSGGIPLDSGIKSLPSWLGLTKPEFKSLLAEPDEKKFMVTMALRCNIKRKKGKIPTVKECDAVYQRVRQIERTELSSIGRYRYTKTTIRGRNGKVLFETYRLPVAFDYYSSRRLQQYGITVTQFFKYLSQELNPKDAIVCAVDRIWATLSDYNRMAQEIVPDSGFTLPHHLHAAHDAMVANYNQIISDRMAMEDGEVDDHEANRFARCYAGKPARVYRTEEFVMVAPEDSVDLYEEGIVLNHCVGTYGNEIMKARGSKLIFFLRKAKAPNVPLVTVQINRRKSCAGTKAPSYELFEIAGKGNRLPTDAEKSFCDAWLLALNRHLVEAEAARSQNHHAKSKIDAFDSDCLSWLTSLGVLPDVLPEYDALLDMDSNYERLFDAAIQSLSLLHSAGIIQVNGDSFQQMLELFSSKLSLAESTLTHTKALLRKIA